MAEIVLNIYPYPLTNLSVTYLSSSYTATDAGDHYTVTIDTTLIPLGQNTLISCDEYVDKSVTLDSIGTYTVCVGNLYAWTTNTSDITVSTIYTTDAIPTNTSVFYDENGNVLDITTIRYPMYKIDSFNSGSSTECIFNSSLATQEF